MAENYIQAPVDGIGKKVRFRDRTVGANTVLEEVNQIVDEGSPVRDAVSSDSLTAGSSADLDASAVAAGTVAKLRKIFLSSTAGLVKWAIKLRDGAVETTIGIVFTTQERPTFCWEPPHDSEDNITYGDGNENFRVTATNLDQENAANVYATFYWTEV